MQDIKRAAFHCIIEGIIGFSTRVRTPTKNRKKRRRKRHTKKEKKYQNTHIKSRNRVSALIILSIHYIYAQREILIFNPQYAHLPTFDIQYRSLWKYNPGHTNSFYLRDFSHFISFPIFNIFSSTHTTGKNSNAPPHNTEGLRQTFGLMRLV